MIAKLKKEIISFSVLFCKKLAHFHKFEQKLLNGLIFDSTIAAVQNHEVVSEVFSMRLRKDANLSAFLMAAQASEGGVFFITTEGDQLNLKSTLSQFVFAVATNTSALPLDGKVLCEADSDYLLLTDYLDQEE